MKLLARRRAQCTIQLYSISFTPSTLFVWIARFANTSRWKRYLYPGSNNNDIPRSTETYVDESLDRSLCQPQLRHDHAIVSVKTFTKV